MAKPAAGSPLLPIEWAAIIGIVLVWGINNIAAKYMTQHIPPIFTGGMRFAIALVFLFPFITPPFPDPKRLLLILLLIGPLNAGLIYLGFSMVHSLSAFIVSLQLWVPFTALFAWLILREAMGGLQLLGLVIAFGGIAWMTLSPGAEGDLAGILIGVAASICWALGTVLVRQMPGLRAFKLQGLTALISVPLMFGAAFMTEKNIVPTVMAAPPMVWVCLIWAAVLSTVGATAIMFWLVQRREPGRIMPYFLMTPLVSSAISVSFMGEVITWQVALGAVATLAGVALVALSERQLAKSHAAGSEAD